jgi:hypothetical protein
VTPIRNKDERGLRFNIERLNAERPNMIYDGKNRPKRSILLTINHLQAFHVSSFAHCVAVLFLSQASSIEKLSRGAELKLMGGGSRHLPSMWSYAISPDLLRRVLSTSQLVGEDQI